MNYGLKHRYYARSFGAISPPSFANFPPVSGTMYPVAVTGSLQTKPPVVPPPLAASGLAPAVCLDQKENSVPCSDPSCTYGDCGSTAPQSTVGALCLDQSQNQIDCSNPNCTYGDCVGASWLTKSTIMSGVPDVAIYGGVLLLVMMLSGGGGYYAGRR